MLYINISTIFFILSLIKFRENISLVKLVFYPYTETYRCLDTLIAGAMKPGKVYSLYFQHQAV